jgi:hypothetical protein
MVPLLSMFKKLDVTLNNLCIQLQKESNSYMTYRRKNKCRLDGLYSNYQGDEKT